MRTAALLALLISGCDPVAFALDTGLVPGLREASAQSCCACLADQAPPEESRGRCSPADDNGRAGCLCEPDGDTCAEVLLAGEVLSVVGACTAEDGPCAEACDSVLAYPAEAP